MQNNGFSNDFLDKLKYNNNIVSVISKYIPLQKKGKTYWACCPFHHEKTPSFAVNEYEQYYHCFGCGESGDVIKFVEKIEGLDFFESVKKLAENANMELPNFIGDDSIIKKKKERDLLVSICTDSAKYYHTILMNKRGEIGLNYLKSRGVSQETIKKLGLGYSDDFRGLVDFLKSKNYTYSQMLKAGVVGEKNGRFYDLMAMRVVFPVIDHQNRVVGFSGRSLDPKAQAKYKNTPQTDLFNKSTVIYCANMLRKVRLEKDKNYAIIVEGQMDVVSLHQAGFTNAIATMGTAFNSNHVQTLKRFVDKVIVCFDGDGAGKKAAVKSLEPLTKEGFEILIITIPENLDPDEYIKKYGASGFQELIDKALPVYEFEIKQLATQYNLKDKMSLGIYIKNAIKIIAEMPSPVDREIYLKLLSQITGTALEFLNRELTNFLNSNQTQAKQDMTKTPIVLEKAQVNPAELLVFSCILHKKNFVKPLEKHIFVNNFFASCLKFLKSKPDFTISDVLNNYNIDEINELKEAINFNFDVHLELEKEYFDSLQKLMYEVLQNKKQDLTQKLTDKNFNADKLSLLKELQEVENKIQLIKKGDF